MKGDIPFAVRKVVDERDGRHCRCCGVYAGTARQHHHVVFGGDVRGMGGQRVHDPEEIVSLCLACHERVHAEKRRWQPLLLRAIAAPGMTAMQLERWDEAAARVRRSNGGLHVQCVDEEGR